MESESGEEKICRMSASLFFNFFFVIFDVGRNVRSEMAGVYMRIVKWQSEKKEEMLVYSSESEWKSCKM